MPDQNKAKARLMLAVADQRESDSRSHAKKMIGAGAVHAAGTAGTMLAHDSYEHHAATGAVRAAKRMKLVRNVSGGAALAALPVMVHQAVKGGKAGRDAVALRNKALETSLAKAFAAELAKADEDGKLPGDNPKAQAARRRRKGGLTLAGAGWLAASRHADVAPGASELMTSSASKIGETARAAKIAARTKLIGRVASRGGAVAVGGGLLAAGEGAVSDLRHRRVIGRAHDKVKAAVEAKRDPLKKGLSPVAQRSRDAVLEKAFDAERSRHNRQAAYTGAATGGALLAGAHGVRNEVKAHRIRVAAAKQVASAAEKNAKVKSGLTLMATHEVPAAVKATQGTKGISAAKQATTHAATLREAAADAHKLHTQAAAHTGTAVRLGERAKKLTRVGRGSLAGAALLGASAYGVHTYDRHHGGRSFGY